jgi:hypothetical protein
MLGTSYFNRRRIRFEHSDRKMKLEIRQADNLDLYITGNLFPNGDQWEITDGYVLDTEYRNKWQDFGASFNGKGLLLTPGGFSI